MSALQIAHEIDESLIIVKIGTESILKTLHQPQNGQKLNRLALDCDVLCNIIDQMALLMAQGKKVLFVTSGAIGRARIMLDCVKTANEVLADKQKLAALGQPVLMNDYNERLIQHGLYGAQVLISKHEFNAEGRLAKDPAAAIASMLADKNILPIINENDTTATHEIRFGDNDMITGLLALHYRPAHVVFLTNSGGIYSCDPRDPAARFMRVMTPKDFDQIDVGCGTTNGSGGMGGKLSVSKRVLSAYPKTQIHIISPKGSIIKAVQGEEEGTLIRSGLNPTVSAGASVISPHPH